MASTMLQKIEGVEQSRRRQRFNAHSNSYSSANSQRIRIDINSSEEYLDFANSYLVFNLKAEGNGATQMGLPRYTASSFIKEVRIKDRAGNMIGENIQDYAVLARCAFEMNVNLEAEKSYYDTTEGASGLAYAARTSIDSRQYAHQFVTSIFGLKDYFPAHLLGGIQIEIDMNSAQDVVLSDDSAATYTIDNLAYVCDMVKLKPQVEAMVINKVQQGGLIVDYNSHHTVKARVSAAQSNARFDLGTLNGRVKNLQAVQIVDAAQNVDQNDSFVDNNLTNYRFKLGSRYLSEAQIETGTGKEAEYVMEWLKSQKALCNKDMTIFGNQTKTTSAILKSTKFVIGQGADRSQSDAVLSSLKDKDHNRLELELNFSSGADSTATLYVFADLDKRLVILPGKQHQDNDFTNIGTNMQ